MNKIAVTASVLFSLLLAGCGWFNTDQIKTDLANAKENTTKKVQEIKVGVGETVEKVTTTVKEVKETAEEVKEAVESIQEAKEAVDEAFGKVKNIGADDTSTEATE